MGAALLALLLAGSASAASPGARGAPHVPAASSPAAAGAPDGCGPIPPEDAADPTAARDDTGALAAAPREPGVQPSSTGERSGGPGAIVPLPATRPVAEPAAEPPSEVLLVLPKGPDGKVPTDFELAPGASVASSYFSPILCATVVHVSGPPGLDPAALVTDAPGEAVTVPNDVYTGAQAELRPLAPAAGDDPYRPLQWGLDRSGAERAWPTSDGRGARVALLDSAPDVGHRDLAGVRLAPLSDAPGAPAPAGPGTHGTLMAGVVRAVASNGFGIAGIAPGAELVGIPVCRPRGASAADECRLFELLRGVDVAWGQGAQLLNLSLVGPPNRLLRKAMDRMDELGVVVVAAAGNEGVAEPRYPAAYPSVIGVGAVDRNGAPYARGNRGASVEILAPGVEVLSTVPGEGFAFGDGTSLAAAHASGVLALAIAASGDARAARAAFFEAAQARSEAPGAEPALLPAACDVLAALGKPCR
ncbi:MAG: S8 family serine peptidase [Deltaproteobacteria bacterium]|nr:S8 family serine peptidase [Deltaproteobacteria bacterium]